MIQRLEALALNRHMNLATSGNIERLVRELVFDSVYVRTDTFWIRITRESGTKGSPTTERGKAMRD